MMRNFLFLATVFLFFCCKETPKEMKIGEIPPEKKTTAKKINYPESLQKVFEAHGGLEDWKNKRTLAYAIPKENATEVHTIDLYSRKDRVDATQFSMGFDGQNVWLND